MKKNEIKEEYLQKLRKLILTTRKQRKMTQAKLAKKVGISQSKISKFEHGSGEISATELILFCKVLRLNFSINCILEEQDDTTGSEGNEHTTNKVSRNGK